MSKLFPIIIMLMLPVTGIANEADIRELQEKCNQARQELIEPFRQEKIEECITKGEKSSEECERFYRDYGEGGVGALGARQHPEFNQIQECVEAREAEAKARKNTKR